MTKKKPTQSNRRKLAKAISDMLFVQDNRTADWLVLYAKGSQLGVWTDWMVIRRIEQLLKKWRV